MWSRSCGHWCPKLCQEPSIHKHCNLLSCSTGITKGLSPLPLSGSGHTHRSLLESPEKLGRCMLDLVSWTIRLEGRIINHSHCLIATLKIGIRNTGMAGVDLKWLYEWPRETTTWIDELRICYDNWRGYRRSRRWQLQKKRIQEYLSMPRCYRRGQWYNVTEENGASPNRYRRRQAVWHTDNYMPDSPSWRWPGNHLEMTWKCPGDDLEITWRWPGSVLEMTWESPGGWFGDVKTQRMTWRRAGWAEGDFGGRLLILPSSCSIDWFHRTWLAIWRCMILKFGSKFRSVPSKGQREEYTIGIKFLKKKTNNWENILNPI